jgi:hypothetical protein
VLTDSEVDRRFAMLVADLNLAAVTVDWPGVSNAAESSPGDEPDPVVSSPPPRVGALRLTAAVIAAAMAGAGLIAAAMLDLGVVFSVVWFVIVVPTVALATLYVVDAVRRRRRTDSDAAS